MTDQSKFFQQLQGLQFYASPVHPCSYIENNKAITLFADPTVLLSNAQYSVLSKIGFRRSGEHVYRPHCEHCSACIPVRVPVNDFQQSRSQRRSWAANKDITIQLSDIEFSDEHYDLYRRYIRSRHPGGGMDDEDVKSYKSFISSAWSTTKLYEFRLQNKLLSVAVTDQLDDALSAVYTYFDPDFEKRSLGIFSVLWQIEHARQNNLKWLYLGYWIKQCKKMAYKDIYRPLEYFDGNNWARIDNN